MDIIFSKYNIEIFKQNTLILGAPTELKEKIKDDLSSKYLVIDNTYKYSTKTVGETITNFNFQVNNFDKIKDKEISELTFDEYYFLALLTKISSKPKALIIDNLFGYLNQYQKNNIIRTANTNNITLIIFDNELYDAYYDFDVIVVHENKTAIQGLFQDVVLEEKILKRLGYELPFYVDLSTQLKLYGNIDKICYTKEELEDCLWK